MTTAKIYALVEKMFFALLAGSCSFMIYYLGAINTSLDSIRDKMAVACEQISAIDAGMREFKTELAKQAELIDLLHPRKG